MVKGDCAKVLECYLEIEQLGVGCASTFRAAPKATGLAACGIMQASFHSHRCMRGMMSRRAGG